MSDQEQLMDFTGTLESLPDDRKKFYEVNGVRWGEIRFTKESNKEYHRIKIKALDNTSKWFTAWPNISRLIYSRTNAMWTVRYVSKTLSGGVTINTIRNAEAANLPEFLVPESNQPNSISKEHKIDAAVVFKAAVDLVSKQVNAESEIGDINQKIVDMIDMLTPVLLNTSVKIAAPPEPEPEPEIETVSDEIDLDKTI